MYIEIHEWKQRQDHHNVMVMFRVKNSGALHRTFNVQPLYLRHENTGEFIGLVVELR